MFQKNSLKSYNLKKNIQKKIKKGNLKKKNLIYMLKIPKTINKYKNQKYYLSENYENIESLMKKKGNSLKICDESFPEFLLLEKKTNFIY